VIHRYTISHKGSTDYVALDAENRETENTLREYVWTKSTAAATDPLTFQVRAINAAGRSAWAEAVVDGVAPEPEPTEPVPTDPEPTDPEPTDPEPTDPEPTDPEPTDPEPTDPEPEPGRTDLPYGADSFFQSSVEGAPVNAARTKQFHEFMATHPEQKDIPYPKINVNENWAMSYHVGRASDPIWTLAGGNTSHEKLAVTRTQGFHMADSVAKTFPDGDQDRPGVMIDSVFGYTVQFADAVPNLATRTITVSNAAVFYHDSNGLDYRNPASDDQRNFSSRGRIIDAMVIRRDLLDKAIATDTGLGHVLHLFFVETNTADGVVHPMVGAEGDKAGFGAEGERIRIKPSVDLEARGLTGAALAVARTLQENGAYIGDNSGSGSQLKASQPHNYVGTNLTTDALEGQITWNDFEVIEKGWQ
jgi:hypothetical protein